MSDAPKNWRDLNRANWDERVAVHLKPTGYDLTALRAIGCDTVENVLALDLGASVRGLGRKTKEELLMALELGGFRHPALEQHPASEIQNLERSLDKMQTRVDAALIAISKEIRLLKQRLRRTRPGVS